MDYEELGHKIRVERIRLKYKQEYLAQMIGVEQKYISKIENGGAKPEFGKICELAKILGISLDYLVGYDGSTNDFLTNSIIIRIKLLSEEEKIFVLEAIDYYLKNLQEKIKNNK